MSQRPFLFAGHLCLESCFFPSYTHFIPCSSCSHVHNHRLISRLVTFEPVLRATSDCWDIPLLCHSSFHPLPLRGLKQADSRTDFKLGVQEIWPRSLFPRTGKVQTSQLLEKPQAAGSQSETTMWLEAAPQLGLRQDQWVDNRFQACPETVSRP